ncbi:CCA tRNA nucleotidyltransferase [Desulfobulbus alkaliphilus]|uniref:CCA tRNA nucleotidyltransferase n=1 Tax=Desulfobulbus alkaliphilus TaxID=869814 RepID=UPI001966C216|nr:HD domain-containing protein [Desulfobulbus alkaliphilus]MBM9536041.1 HD domain-containing protein [Desulfobulbus alkaliphilus]
MADLKVRHGVPISLDWCRLEQSLPPWLWSALADCARRQGQAVYLTGGAVRDLLLGGRPVDIDITVPVAARWWAKELAASIGGTCIILGREEEAARVVRGEWIIDISSFRQGTRTIEEELTRRDLTVNALAVRIDPLLGSLAEQAGNKQAVPVLDPTGGLTDLADQRIRAVAADTFTVDPLRLLRVFRFAATLGFTIDDHTLTLVHRQRRLLRTVAPERVTHELHLLMVSPGSHSFWTGMASTGVLEEIFPELTAGTGMEQPKSHHLDVFAHSLEALRQVERILVDPVSFFPGCSPAIFAYLDIDRNRLRLKWAALLHDLGKPETRAVDTLRGSRITFHNHDRVGAQLFRSIAHRLRWSRDDTEHVASLISWHMRPFHLANVARTHPLTLRAAIRMIKKCGVELPGLFLLAMADALAGQGVERVKGMETELIELYRHLEQVRLTHVEPVRSNPPLLTGKDLINVLHLCPGPLFKKILIAVEEGRMEGTVRDYNDALRLAAKYAAGAGQPVGKGI